MGGPLEGIRVVELGVWVAGPATAGILADWGADVIKVEPPAGDPMRAMMRLAAGSAEQANPPFDADNRGKRSVILDLRSTEDAATFEVLLRSSDVLVTNLRQDALGRLGSDLRHDAVRARHPHLVYTAITGYGLTGPDAGRAGYDTGAFHARSGLADRLRVGEDPPPPLPGGFGDHVTALAAVTGTLAALLERSRTGTGTLVDTSLLRAGTYCQAWELGIQQTFGKTLPVVPRERIANPVFNSYRSSDGRWFWLLGLEADRHFPPTARAAGRPELLEDPRFADARSRRHACEALNAALTEAFAGIPMAELVERFDAEDVWWAPVNTLGDVVADPQSEAAGAFVDMATGPRSVAPPATIGTPIERAGPVPALGQHTAEVLAELGR